MDKLKPCPICGGDAAVFPVAVACNNISCHLWGTPFKVDAWQALPRAVGVSAWIGGDDRAYITIWPEELPINAGYPYYDVSTARRGIKRFCKRNGLKLTKIEVA